MEAYQGGKCLIATELYGSDSPEVATLRRFRDERLLNTRAGKLFVDTYYRVAPRVVPLMRRSGLVRSALHSMVATSVLVAQHALGEGMAGGWFSRRVGATTEKRTS
jgi:hypothetical protein